MNSSFHKSVLFLIVTHESHDLFLGPQRQLSAEYPAHTAQEVIQGSQVVAVGTALPTTSFPSGAQQGPVMVSLQLHYVMIDFDIFAYIKNLMLIIECVFYIIQ